MMFSGIRAVMVFVEDPSSAASWWSMITGAAVNADGEFRWLNVPGGVELGFHPADDARNPRGASPVVYWSVADLDVARATLLAAGAVHHRGPLRIGDQRQIAQMKDPFGTVIGLDGP